MTSRDKTDERDDQVRDDRYERDRDDRDRDRRDRNDRDKRKRSRRSKCRPPQISLIVPFRADKLGSHRSRIWKWLEEYWSWELPDAEVIVANSKGKPFSKTQAVNDAVRRSRGRILVIIDSDCYISGDVIRHCAVAIDEALRQRKKLWFVPYRHLYRLTEDACHRVLESDPRTPERFYSPPSDEDVESTQGSMHGHRFGAMIQIMPREAFEAVGCWDNRMRGWGGEDVAFVRACDTLYARHQSTDNDVIHLWHESIGVGFKERAWEGQISPRANEQLASRYNRATGDRVRMRKLVDEGCKPSRRYKKRSRWRTWYEGILRWFTGGPV